MHHDQLFPRCCAGPTSDRFTKFQRLPPEIRNMIWEYALPEPRVYEVLDAPNAKQKTPPQEGLMFANVHPEPPPALAAACRESRSFVLHHYKPLTLGQTTKFVDMSRDILLLEPYLLVKRLHRTLHFMSQIPLVRDHAARLALGTSYGVYPGIFHPVLGRRVGKNNMGKLLAGLARFLRLRTIVFVVHQEFQFEFDFRFSGALSPGSSYGAPASSVGFGAQGLLASTTNYLSLPLSRGLSAGSSSSQLQASAPASTTGGLPTPASSKPTSPVQPAPLPYETPQRPPPPPPLPLHLQPSHQQSLSTLQQPQQYQHPQATLNPSLLPPPLPLPAPTRVQEQAHSSSNQTPVPQQQVHQAYRFKFDIEANINARPRRPHTNELLYYPLDVRAGRDEFDEYESYVKGYGSGSASPRVGSDRSGSMAFGSGGGGFAGRRGYGCDDLRWERLAAAAAGDGSDGEEDGEWCDPWPTNDDWRRFKRRWVRGMVAACLPPSSGHGGEVEGEDTEGGSVRGGDGKGCAGGSVRGGKGVGTAAREKITFPKWKLKGASLLWRYTRGVGTSQ